MIRFGSLEFMSLEIDKTWCSSPPGPLSDTQECPGIRPHPSSPHVPPCLRVRRRMRRIRQGNHRVRGAHRLLGEPRWRGSRPQGNADSFKLVEAMNTIHLDPSNSSEKTLRISSQLEPK
jgi:hypothetical protein